MRTLGPEASYRLCNSATPRAELINTSGTCSAAALAQPGLCQAAGVPSALSKAPQPGPSLLPKRRQFQPNLSAWLGFFSLPTVCQWLQNYIFCFVRLWQTASKVMKKTQKNKQTNSNYFINVFLRNLRMRFWPLPQLILFFLICTECYHCFPADMFDLRFLISLK